MSAGVAIAGLVASAAGLVLLIASCATAAVSLAVVAAIEVAATYLVAMGGLLISITTWRNVVLEAGSSLSTPQIEWQPVWS